MPKTRVTEAERRNLEGQCRAEQVQIDTPEGRRSSNIFNYMQHIFVCFFVCVCRFMTSTKKTRYVSFDKICTGRKNYVTPQITAIDCYYCLIILLVNHSIVYLYCSVDFVVYCFKSSIFHWWLTGLKAPTN